MIGIPTFTVPVGMDEETHLASCRGISSAWGESGIFDGWEYCAHSS